MIPGGIEANKFAQTRLLLEAKLADNHRISETTTYVKIINQRTNVNLLTFFCDTEKIDWYAILIRTVDTIGMKINQQNL